MYGAQNENEKKGVNDHCLDCYSRGATAEKCDSIRILMVVNF